MPGEKPREIAARVLTQRGSGEFVETLLEKALAGGDLKPEDRRFLQELVYGVVRWEMPLDRLIAEKSGGRPQKPLVQNLLRLALYQMFWLDRVPSYAAVNETVEICKRADLLAQSKFVNAVLRNYGREMEQTRARLVEWKNTQLALGYSHPEWLCRRWELRWGREKTRQLLDWNNTPPATYARVNRLKATPEELAQRWTGEGVEGEAAAYPWIPAGSFCRLTKHPALAQLGSFQAGLFYVQDPSTLLAPAMLEPHPGEAVLDVCAAPGGKTGYIAQLMNNEGRILAEDLDPERLKLVQANCARLGANSVAVDPASFSKDALFDRVLVDAPCSNTGVMRRRVELRWRIKPDEIDRLARLQLKILGEAARRVRPGGVLVYSTCSLEPDENLAVVQEFMAAHPAFRLDQQRELSPFQNGTDGAYCARLVRLS